MAPDDGQDDAARGVLDLARSILDHGADYAEARLALARLEAEDAGRVVRGVSIRLAVGIFAVISGYTTCLVAGIALLGRSYFGGHWELPALIAGTAHLAIGLLFLLGARRQARLAPELFPSTRREFTNDHRWLKQKSTPAPIPTDDAPN